eukprot:1149012-Pelagomonas_calceolata.AAC.5
MRAGGAHWVAKCREVLNKVMKSMGPDVKVFYDRVSPAILPDYYRVITKPIFLCDIESKLNTGEYQAPQVGPVLTQLWVQEQFLHRTARLLLSPPMQTPLTSQSNQPIKHYDRGAANPPPYGVDDSLHNNTTVYKSSIAWPSETSRQVFMVCRDVDANISCTGWNYVYIRALAALGASAAGLPSGKERGKGSC